MIVGLTFTGMPASSPKMDVPGNSVPFQVIAFEKDATKRVYNQYHVK